MHRKLWEWAYISQALEERGMLAPGRRGLGFAVGEEPLTDMFASRGCSILATDHPEARGWAADGQHAAGLESLRKWGLTPAEDFAARVAFRPVDSGM